MRRECSGQVRGRRARSAARTKVGGGLVCLPRQGSTLARTCARAGLVQPQGPHPRHGGSTLCRPRAGTLPWARRDLPQELLQALFARALPQKHGAAHAADLATLCGRPGLTPALGMLLQRLCPPPLAPAASSALLCFLPFPSLPSPFCFLLFFFFLSSFLLSSPLPSLPYSLSGSLSFSLFSCPSVRTPVPFSL